MVTEAIADLELNPQTGEAGTAAGVALAEEPGKPKQPKPTVRRLKFWIPAAAALLIVCALSALWFTRSWVPWSSAAADERAPGLTVPLASTPAPAAAAAGETRAPETVPDRAPFAITVEPDQTLQDVSKQYLGGYDMQRLHQIQALNPKLKDPDHIEVGQKIRLPGPPSGPVEGDAKPPSGERNTP